MFIVLLRFAKKEKAGKLMEGHKAWIQRGFDDGVFLLTGSLQPDQGGCVLAAGGSRAELERRVKEDPFVAEGVVTTEILEVASSRADARLGWLA